MKSETACPARTSTSQPTRRVKMLVKRAIVEKRRAHKHYDKSKDAVTKAIQCGLKIGQAVELELTADDGAPVHLSFELVDNFAGDTAYRNASIPHFELRKIPKIRRTPQPLNPSTSQQS